MLQLTMDSDKVAEWGPKFRDLAEPHTNGEAVIAAAMFRRGGSSATYIADKGGLGFAVRAGVKLFNKSQAGGLPQQMLLAVTEHSLYAFDFKWKKGGYVVKEEAAHWDRAALRLSTDRKMGMTSLTIESPADGEKATVFGAGMSDDPLSQAVIETLMGAVAVA